MASKVLSFKIRGMNRDLSVSSFNPEFAYENHNIRITAKNDLTLLDITNEKGTREVAFILGLVLGYSLILDQLILFARKLNEVSKPDFIYKVVFSKDSNGNLTANADTLWNGDLQFDINYPIETLSSYENKDVLKVYWVDGKNQPRLINIAEDVSLKDAEYFNFLPALAYLPSNVIFTKKDSGGLFPSGVVLYFLTFINKNGQESAIFRLSDLFGTSFVDKGASPESGTSSAFTLTIYGDVPSSPIFEYIRIYSIVRTSLNAVPTAKRIKDIKLPRSGSYTLKFTDDNTYGETIDPSELLYKGGDLIIASTIAQKDNTLFLGDIKAEVLNINDSDIPSIIANGNVTASEIIRYVENDMLSVYPYDPYTLNGNIKRIFKSNDWVRLGVIFLHKSGKWSEPVWLKDYRVPNVIGSTYTGVLTYIKGNYLTYTQEGGAAYIYNALKEAGYIRARGVAVFPEPGQGEVIALGVLCPTVHNVGDRKSGLITNYSSWFFRPQYLLPARSYLTSRRWGSAVESSHDYMVNSSKNIAGEILSMDEVRYVNDPELVETNSYDDYFFVDSSVVTFHSPDIEFNTYINNMSLGGLKLRVVGACGLAARFSSLNLTAAASNEDASFIADTPENLYVKTSGIPITAYQRSNTMSATLSWRDYVYSTDTKVDFAVYPWHRNGPLKDAPDSDEGTLSELQQKKMSNLRYCEETFYLPTPLNMNMYDAKLYSSDLEDLISLSLFLNGQTACIYKGNVDKILNTNGRSYNLYYTGLDEDMGEKTLSYSNSSKLPIRMKYKSTPHIVIAMKELLPVIDLTYISRVDETYYCPTSNYTRPRALNLSTDTFGTKYMAYLLIGEIYRDTTASDIFGDTTNDTIRGLKWVPAGDSVRLDQIYKNGNTIQISFDAGNAFFTRYDCLKTYPYTLEDLNSVVEIGSFLLESFINMDGRYDGNIGNISNLVALPSNFNLINPIYSLMDNFINYRVLDDRINTTTEYPNTIVWSKTKQSGALIDAWTSINLASSIDVDGTYGRVRALRLFNNQLIGFLDNATFNLLYNSRILIPTSDLVPIEIANSGKVDGKVYLSNTIGLTNKWSIALSSEGLYFIDNNLSSIYKFNGKFLNISTSLGFHSWMSQNNTTTPFTSPRSFDNFKSYYDKSNNDIYFVNKDTCLCFSETLNTFTSFYDYPKCLGMFNIMDRFIALHELDYHGSSSDATNIYELNAGDYNNFFYVDNYKPYYITVIANLDYSLDKIFNILEYRADMYDASGEYLPYLTFDTLEVWDTYLKGASDLLDKAGHPSNLKKKFNVWRANIPRAVNTRNRIRNTSAFIKLGVMKEANCKKNLLMRLHDLMVHYTI